MEKSLQYKSSIRIEVNNLSVQYGKVSTIHYFNTEKYPQYTSSIMEKGPQYISSISKKGPQYICSIQKSVHNTLVQYGERSTIYKFNME